MLWEGEERGHSQGLHTALYLSLSLSLFLSLVLSFPHPCLPLHPYPHHSFSFFLSLSLTHSLSLFHPYCDYGNSRKPDTHGFDPWDGRWTNVPMTTFKATRSLTFIHYSLCCSKRKSLCSLRGEQAHNTKSTSGPERNTSSGQRRVAGWAGMGGGINTDS